MKLSVLLPCRNAAGTIGPCLESLIVQNCSEYEIVAVDDGSTDGTGAALDDWARQHPRIRVVHLPPVGIVEALNIGLSQCHGFWVARMDADDIALPERLDAQMAWLEDHPKTQLNGCLVRHGGNSLSQGGYARYVDWINSKIFPKDIAMSRFVESPFAHPSVVFNRRLVLDLGGYRQGEFPEDYDLVLRLLQLGTVMDKVRKTLLIWNDPPDRLSRTDSRYSISAFYRLKSQFLADWLREHNPFHPEIHVFGSSRTVRQRASCLVERGIRVRGYFDVDPRRIGRLIHGAEVRHLRDLPAAGRMFGVSLLGKRGVREDLEIFLTARGHRVGEDYILAA
ncbi:MAG: glycosyltransferase [Deltaproteobacteria bacterium]|nr:glycosyltransferase [Deltaproteobacteria bacterium]